MSIACTVTNAQGAANVPTPCKVTFTAYSDVGSNQKVGEQVETFTPKPVNGNPLLSSMMRVTSKLPPAKLVKVTASLFQVPGLDRVDENLAAIFMDNVIYTQYDSSGAGKSICGKGFGE